MPRKKLKRFDDIKKYKNVLEYPKNTKGKWGAFFQNKNPIILELGCGKGEYTVELAKKYPKKNFIGVDLKGERIWCGATRAIQENLQNVAFLRTYIESIQDYFKKNEVSEIWITFPDPFPRRRSEKRRLTSERFLKLYRPILKKGGVIHLKTDAEKLFDFSLRSLSENKFTLKEERRDIHSGGGSDEIQTILTTYEKKYINQKKPIFYCKFAKKS